MKYAHLTKSCSWLLTRHDTTVAPEIGPNSKSKLVYRSLALSKHKKSEQRFYRKSGGGASADGAWLGPGLAHFGPQSPGRHPRRPNFCIGRRRNPSRRRRRPRRRTHRASWWCRSCCFPGPAPQHSSPLPCLNCKPPIPTVFLVGRSQRWEICCRTTTQPFFALSQSGGTVAYTNYIYVKYFQPLNL